MDRRTSLSKYTVCALVEPRRSAERVPEALCVHGKMQNHVPFLDPRNSHGFAQAQEAERRVHQRLPLPRRETRSRRPRNPQAAELHGENHQRRCLSRFGARQ